MSTDDAKTYETMYNQAYQHILQNNLSQAEKLLRACEKMARETLAEEGYTEEELEQELAIIKYFSTPSPN